MSLLSLSKVYKNHLLVISTIKNQVLKIILKLITLNTSNIINDS